MEPYCPEYAGESILPAFCIIAMKKILIATGVYPPESGGPATYAALLEERLPGLGFSVSVLPFSTVRHLPKVVRHAAYFFACLNRAKESDIVYALDTVSVGFPAALAALLLRKKFVVRVPGDYAWEQARQRFGVVEELDAFQNNTYGWRVSLLRAVQRFVVRHARAVVVPSEYLRGIVSRWGCAPRVIYSSIDLAPAYNMPKDRPQGFLVVSSGRRVPWKGFEGIARVVAQEGGWHFFLAEDLPRTEALGWVKTADVFVLNSTYEGLSYALVEAMALGTPVVATAVGGNPELITNGVDGLLVPPGDDAALHEALKRVQQDPEGARARAQSARAKVGQFSIGTALEKLAGVFTAL